MPFNHLLQSEGVLQFLQQQQQEEELVSSNFWGIENNNNSSKRLRKGAIFSSSEPTSVLDKRRSPSPPNSSSTLSSSFGSGGGGGGSSDSAAGAPKLRPVPPSLDVVGPEKCGLGGPQIEDWEAMLSGSNGHDQSFLHWITGENAADEINGSSFGLVDSAFNLEPISAPSHTSFNPMANPLCFHEQIEEKPLVFNPNFVMNHQNPTFFSPLPQFAAPQLETHHPHFPSSANVGNNNNNAGSLFLRRNQLQSPVPMKVKGNGGGGDELVDQLFKAAELVEAGNSIGARGILARLNQIFPSHPVIGKPLFRSAFYFKEALLLLANNTPSISSLSTPLDVLLKLGTYKAFSEISPIVQFTNFTSIQAILEEVNGCDHIHLVDFDVGVGGHWSSFMQELAHRRGGVIPSLKITAFATHLSHHPLELHLTKENLSHFAADLNIPFEFLVLGLDSFDTLLAMSSPNEAIAVNFPIGSTLNYQSIPTILRLIKQLNPKIVVSVEHGCDRSDLTFSHHFLHGIQSCTVLFDSIDASGANQDISNKIERYLVQPRIENVVLGRNRAFEKMVPWRTLFTSVGFAPIQFSNFTETQAECLLKRVQVRGFQVEKRQASLFLCWQRGELVSVSAWK